MVVGASAASAALPPLRTSIEDYQLWAHGFALTASLYHARSILGLLVGADLKLDALCALTGCCSGHLGVILRTLGTIGWVTRTPDGWYSTTEAVAAVAASPTLAELCEDVYGEAHLPQGDGDESGSAEAWGSHLPRLARWLERLQSGLELPSEAAHVPHLLVMLSGAVLAPSLLELRMASSSYTAKAHEGKHEHASSLVKLDGLVDAAAAAAIGLFFAGQQWGSYAPSTRELSLNETGLFILERCPAFGVCLSYRPMLHALGTAARGETSAVFKYEHGHEAWVDRKLNVIGSGFMHNRYFADMMSCHIRQLFDAQPLHAQPRVVADMGCGDGTLLKTIYLYVAAHTKRGSHLDEYPLTMCGVDFNDTSCAETARTLTAAGVPHGTMFGDIGDPLPMQQALEAQFGVTRDQVLHVRSFLDHDRPYIPPSRPMDAGIAAAIDWSSDATYVNNSAGGVRVTPAEAYYSLVEHWERWAACLGTHGLLVLEVNCLDVATTRTYMREATSMHFDCVQSHSGQMLMPATHFCLGAATAGLLPTGDSLTYPKDSSYTRIVLQRLAPAGVRIRLATLDDMPQLIALEAFWRTDVLSAAEDVLRARLTAHPTGQYVVESVSGAAGFERGGGELLAAMYTQRVSSYETLLTATRARELELHEPSGRVIQLLGVVQRPGAPTSIDGRSNGQLLRDFVVHLGRLDATVDRACGVTRCREYRPASRVAYDAHVRACTDSGLLFHKEAGASIGELVPNYRPRDTQNLGYGVMICYEFTAEGRKRNSAHVASGGGGIAARDGGGEDGEGAHDSTSLSESSSSRPLPRTERECEEVVCAALDALRYDGGGGWDAEARTTPFMKLGVDSLDAPRFVQSLNNALSPHVALGGTVMFEYPDVKALGARIHELLAPHLPLETTQSEAKAEAAAAEGAEAGGEAMTPYQNGLVPWRYSTALGTDSLQMAQAQATGEVTVAMIEEALAGSCL